MVTVADWHMWIGHISPSLRLISSGLRQIRHSCSATCVALAPLAIRATIVMQPLNKHDEANKTQF